MMDNAYGLPVMHGVDADSDEQFVGNRKSEILGKAIESKLMGKRSATKRSMSAKKPKLVLVGRFEDAESVMPMRERTEFTEMNDFESFMGEDRRIPKEPTVFVAGLAGTPLGYKTAAELRKPLPTSRVFKLGHKPGVRGLRWVERMRFCD